MRQGAGSRKTSGGPRRPKGPELFNTPRGCRGLFLTQQKRPRMARPDNPDGDARAKGADGNNDFAAQSAMSGLH